MALDRQAARRDRAAELSGARTRVARAIAREAGGPRACAVGVAEPRGTRALLRRGWAPSGRVQVRRRSEGTSPVDPYRTRPGASGFACDGQPYASPRIG